jgi:hypothetical protein
MLFASEAIRGVGVRQGLARLPVDLEGWRSSEWLAVFLRDTEDVQDELGVGRGLGEDGAGVSAADLRIAVVYSLANVKHILPLDINVLEPLKAAATTPQTRSNEESQSAADKPSGYKMDGQSRDDNENGCELVPRVVIRVVWRGRECTVVVSYVQVLSSRPIPTQNSTHC